MKLLKGVGDFFALDIGTSAVRVVQLDSTGDDAWSLKHYGYAPLDSVTAQASSADSRRRIGEVIMTAVGQSGVKTKNVIIGLPSDKTFTTIVDVSAASVSELKSTMRYQVDQYIPMSVDDAKVDWALLGQSLHDKSKQEVLITSTAISYAEERLESVEALGFNVIAAEPEPIALVRSLLPQNANDARIIINMGETSTDLVATYNGTPRLVRNIPTGLSTLVRAAVQNLNVQDDQARQFILKFGLAPDRLDGQVYQALETTLESFASELSKSIKFFQTRYQEVPLAGLLLSGYAAAVPMFDNFVSTRTSIQTAVANPWQKVQVNQADAQQLAAVGTEFAAAVGLAQRKGKL